MASALWDMTGNRFPTHTMCISTSLSPFTLIFSQRATLVVTNTLHWWLPLNSNARTQAAVCHKCLQYPTLFFIPELRCIFKAKPSNPKICVDLEVLLLCTVLCSLSNKHVWSWSHRSTKIQPHHVNVMVCWANASLLVLCLCVASPPVSSLHGHMP